MKHVPQILKTIYYTVILLITFFVLQSLLILMHEFTHSTVAWFFGDMQTPLGIVWGNPFMMTGWDEGVHYSKLFPAPGNYVEAVIGASPLLVHALIVVAGHVLLQKKSMLKHKWLFHVSYWFVIANYMELIAYIMMRGFASGGDTGHFNHGLHLSPWYLFIIGTGLLIVGLSTLFKRIIPHMYTLFAQDNRGLQWVIFSFTAVALFLWGSGMRVVFYVYPDPQWMFGLIGFVAFGVVLKLCRPCKLGPSAVCIVLMLLAGGCLPTGEHRLQHAVMKHPDEWCSISNQFVTVYGRNEDLVRRAAAFAAFSGAKIERLIPNGTGNGVHSPVVLLVDDPADWEQLIERYDLKPEGLSLQAGREVLIQAKEPRDLMKSALPHELLHYAMHAADWQLPLALEEGVASRFGWEFALEYYLTEGSVLRRRDASVEPMISLQSLEVMKSYPAEPDQLAAFYDESERWVDALQQWLGPDAFCGFLAETGTGKNWRDVLRDVYNATDRDIDWIRQMVEAHDVEHADG